MVFNQHRRKTCLHGITSTISNELQGQIFATDKVLCFPHLILSFYTAVNSDRSLIKSTLSTSQQPSWGNLAQRSSLLYTNNDSELLSTHQEYPERDIFRPIFGSCHLNICYICGIKLYTVCSSFRYCNGAYKEGLDTIVKYHRMICSVKYNSSLIYRLRGLIARRRTRFDGLKIFIIDASRC